MKTLSLIGACLVLMTVQAFGQVSGGVSRGTVTNIVNGNVPSLSVRKYGAVGDGSTDDTTAVQAALNAGGEIWFPDGTYVVGNLIGTNNTRLLGRNAVLSFKAGVTNYCLDFGGATSNVWIEGITLDGGDRSDVFAPRVLGTRHGLKVNTATRLGKFRVAVLGFSYGINSVGTLDYGTTYQGPASSYEGCEVYSNYTGAVWLSPDSSHEPEYSPVLGLISHDNSVGLEIDAANVQLIGSRVTHNNHNIHIYPPGAGGNAHHGIIQGCLISHDVAGSMNMSGITSGYSIMGNRFAAAQQLNMTNCASVCFQGNVFGPMSVISWSGGSGNLFINNFYSDTWSGGSFNLANVDGSFSYFGNRSTTTPGNTDGSFQSLSSNAGITDNGVAPIYASVHALAQAAAINATTLYTPSTTNGVYRISGCIAVVTAGTGTNATQIVFQGAGDGAATTVTLMVQNVTGTMQTTNSVPLTAQGQFSFVPIVIQSTNAVIQYKTVNNIGGSAKYDLHLSLEALNSK